MDRLAAAKWTRRLAIALSLLALGSLGAFVTLIILTADLWALVSGAIFLICGQGAFILSLAGRSQVDEEPPIYPFDRGA